MNRRFPFAPGAIEHRSRLRSRAGRVCRWLVRHSTAIGLLLILAAGVAWLLGLRELAWWAMALAVFVTLMLLDRLERAEDRRELEDL